IVVFDIDDKVKEIISRANKELNLNIKFVEHDLREPIPEEYREHFDCFLTDPPYTQNGLKLFVSRGLQLLSKTNNGVFYLSFGTKPPNEMLAIQKDLTDMGCLITDVLPGFNEYIGAQKLGGISTMYRIIVGVNSSPLILEKYNGHLYTGDINPIIRTYICMDCKTEYLIGKKQQFSTIEQLKNHGCTKCKNTRFQKKSEKKME
ncbi:putative methyltransferase, partial [Candidatus Heimdallarchaeota archaeon]